MQSGRDVLTHKNHVHTTRPHRTLPLIYSLKQFALVVVPFTIDSADVLLESNAGHASTSGSASASTTSYHLLSAGSNSGGQLGTGSLDDSHIWSPALCQPSGTSDDSSSSHLQAAQSFPPAGTRVLQLAGGANHSLALLVEESSGETAVWRTGDGQRGQWGAAGPGTDEEGKEDRTTVFTPLPGLADLLHLSGQPLAAEVRSGLKPKLVAASWENSYIVYTPSLPSDSAEQQGDDVLLVLGRENDFGQAGLGRGPSQVGASGVGLISLAGALPRDEEGFEGKGSGRGRVEIVRLVGSVRHVVLIASWLSSASPSGKSGAQRRRRYALIGWGAGRQGQLGSLDALESTQGKGRGASAGAGNIIWTPRLIRLWSSQQLEIDAQASLSLGRDHTALLVPSHWRSEDASSSSVPGRSEEEQSETRLLLLGSNKYGQLDLWTRLAQEVVSVACTWNSTLIALADGSLLGSGRNDKGQLGGEAEAQQQQQQEAQRASIAPAQIARVPAIDVGSGGQVSKQNLVCGSEHALLLLHRTSSEGGHEGGESTLWGWGWNEHGNLALGGQRTSNEGPDEEEEEEAVEDQRTPVRLWPAPVALTATGGGSAQEVHEVATDIWAGCATSFVQVLRTQK